MSTDIPTTVGVMADGSKVYICTECWQSETPKIICLCGSTKFKKEFEETELELTLEGKIVLTVGGFMHADVLAISEEQKRGLDRLHKRKIELSDMVLVLNVGGYIGESTMSEVEYAIRCRKPVVYKYPTQ
jgi:hypothetical protein